MHLIFFVFVLCAATLLWTRFVGYFSLVKFSLSAVVLSETSPRSHHVQETARHRCANVVCMLLYLTLLCSVLGKDAHFFLSNNILVWRAHGSNRQAVREMCDT